MSINILVLPGDGIGPEITAATLKVLDAADRRFGLGLAYEHAEIGFVALKKYGTTLPDGVLDRARASHGAILGPISHLDYPPRDQGGVNISAAFRVQLDLFANVRPARTRPGLGSFAKSMDLVIMREATEGFSTKVEDLERIGASYRGVDQAHAVHGGRELRVYVREREVDDLGVVELSSDIAAQIAAEMTFPGQIKVTVIRAFEAVATAS